MGMTVEQVLRKTGESNSITDVHGISVGNFTDPEILSGVTVVMPDESCVCGVDLRGSAPGTREIPLLDPVCLIQGVNAITLSGGSAFGLSTASGVMRFLEEKGQGYITREGCKVPIIPAAIIYDLYRGKVRGKLCEKSGYAACESLSRTVLQGNVGAGTGAMAGGIKGGLGTASEVLPGGVKVGAISVVNSAGNVADPVLGGLYARYLGLEEEFNGVKQLPINSRFFTPLMNKLYVNTVIGVVATDANLNKSEITKVAMMAHDGIARAIYPAHTMFDGDTVFALATGRNEVNAKRANMVSLIGAIAADVFSRSIVHGVLAADSVAEIKSYKDRFPSAFE